MSGKRKRKAGRHAAFYLFLTHTLLGISLEEKQRTENTVPSSSKAFLAQPR